MSLSRRELLLAILLVLAVVAIAVLVTTLVVRDTSGASGSSVAAPSPTPVDTSIGEPLPASTPTATTNAGIVLPGLLAAMYDCDSVFPLESGWAVLRPTLDDVDPLSPPSVLEIRGADSETVELIEVGAFPGGEPLRLYECVLGTLGAPAGMVERMESTRAIDGTLEESWPGYRITWTYHPDTGLDAVVSYAD